MRIRESVGLVALLTASSFIGGMLAVWLLDSSSVHAQDNVMRSQRFDAIDGDGKVGARFGVGQDGKPFFALLDHAGKQRLSAAVNPNGSAALTISGRDDRKRVEAGLGADDTPYVTLTDRGGKATIGLAVDAKGTPGLNVVDKDGATVALLSIGEDGKAALTFPEKVAVATAPAH